MSTLGGQSAQMQLDVLPEYATPRTLEIAGEFVDRGVSGARDHRPALDQLMRGARQRHFEVVLVYRFDRFARSVRHPGHHRPGRVPGHGSRAGCQPNNATGWLAAYALDFAPGTAPHEL